MPDHAALAQQAAEAHLEACYDSLDDEGDGEAPDTLGPYCGCITCDVREVLYAAYPHLRDLALEEEGGLIERLNKLMAKHDSEVPSHVETITTAQLRLAIRGNR